MPDRRKEKLKEFQEYCALITGERHEADAVIHQVAALAYAVGFLGAMLTEDQIERLPGV